jgi:hypothetical protein
VAKLTMAERKRLPKSDFAVPSKAPGSGSYPITDQAHSKAAVGLAVSVCDVDAPTSLESVLAVNSTSGNGLENAA